MELSNLKVAQEPVRLELTHPLTGEVLLHEKTKKPVAFLVVGTDSAQYKKIDSKYKNAAMNRRFKGKVDPETLEDMTIELNEKLLSCIEGWENITYGGEDLEFNKENVKKVVFDDALPWISEQLTIFMAMRENFMQVSSQK